MTDGMRQKPENMLKGKSTGWQVSNHNFPMWEVPMAARRHQTILGSCFLFAGSVRVSLFFNRGTWREHSGSLKGHCCKIFDVRFLSQIVFLKAHNYPISVISIFSKTTSVVNSRRVGWQGWDALWITNVFCGFLWKIYELMLVGYNQGPQGRWFIKII